MLCPLSEASKQLSYFTTKKKKKKKKERKKEITQERCLNEFRCHLGLSSNASSPNVHFFNLTEVTLWCCGGRKWGNTCTIWRHVCQDKSSINITPYIFPKWVLKACGLRYWMASPTQWTWTWWWGTRKPGVLQSTGSQRVGTWLGNWTTTGLLLPFLLFPPQHLAGWWI